MDWPESLACTGSAGNVMLPVYVDANGDGHVHRSCICVMSGAWPNALLGVRSTFWLLAGDGLPELFGIAAQIELAASGLVVEMRDIAQ